MSLYFKQYQAYLETLAREHVDLVHSDTNHAFSRFESEDELNKLKARKKPFALIVGTFYGRSKGGIDEGKMTQYASLYFVGRVKRNPENQSAELENVLQKCWEIMMDFYARHIEDMMDDDCGPLKGLRPEEMSWDPIEEQPILDNHFGWEMLIPFVVDRPIFNPEKWNSND